MKYKRKNLILELNWYNVEQSLRYRNHPRACLPKLDWVCSGLGCFMRTYIGSLGQTRLGNFSLVLVNNLNKENRLHAWFIFQSQWFLIRTASHKAVRIRHPWLGKMVWSGTIRHHHRTAFFENRCRLGCIWTRFAFSCVLSSINIVKKKKESSRETWERSEILKSISQILFDN